MAFHSSINTFFENVTGAVNDVATTIVSEFQEFAENIVAAGAAVLNDFLNVLAGPAARDKVISEFSTQNSYFFTDDAYIDNLHNTDKIALNSLIRGTSITDEVIDFYKKAGLSNDFNLEKAYEYTGRNNNVSSTALLLVNPGIGSNFAPLEQLNLPIHPGYFSFRKILPSATLRVNNTNLYAGSAPASQYDSTGARFTWHSTLNPDTYNYLPDIDLDSSSFAVVQANTKNYLKYLGMPEPETLLDDLPYDTDVGGGSNDKYKDVIDSAFINFRVKWVSGIGSATGNRVSNKYLWLLAERLYHISDMPHVLTYDETAGSEEIWMFQYEVAGDGHYYNTGLSHVSRSINNSISHADYQYDRDLISSDGYYYYDANKTLPNGYYSAQTIANVSSYLTNSGTTEGYANWLEIEQNAVAVTIDGVESVFPDEIYLPGSGITLVIHVDATIDGTYVEYKDAEDQVLRVGNLYIKKSTTEIMFASLPFSDYSNASITYGRSNTTGVSYYTVHNVTAIERITDYANDTPNANFRYVSHKLDASNNCVSVPVLTDILEYLDPFEQHKLVLASANLSLHLAYYLRIPATLEQKLFAAALQVIKIGAIIYTVVTLGAASSLVVLAETVIIAYATSLAINVAIEHILVPAIISNFGEDEALILLAVAAIAITIYSSKSGTAGLNQFPNQVTLFTASIDMMNQMYTLAVVQPGLIEMQKEQEELIATDTELTEKEEAFQEKYDALFGTDDSPSTLLNLQTRAALNPMPASAYFGYHDGMLERQFDCYDYDKYNTLNVS